MSLLIRPAIISDVHDLALLAEHKRAQYTQWQPLFHRPAEGAKALHTAYLLDLLHHEDSMILVADDRGTVMGFLFGEFRKVPPVYNPGGKVFLIDDFCVRDEAHWPATGAALLRAARERAKSQGAVLVNVVCGPRDEVKRRVLEEAGLSVASEWWVG